MYNHFPLLGSARGAIQGRLFQERLSEENKRFFRPLDVLMIWVVFQLKHVSARISTQVTVGYLGVLLSPITTSFGPFRT